MHVRLFVLCVCTSTWGYCNRISAYILCALSNRQWTDNGYFIRSICLHISFSSSWGRKLRPGCSLHMQVPSAANFIRNVTECLVVFVVRLDVSNVKWIRTLNVEDFKIHRIDTDASMHLGALLLWITWLWVSTTNLNSHNWLLPIVCCSSYHCYTNCMLCIRCQQPRCTRNVSFVVRGHICCFPLYSVVRCSLQ